MNRLEARSCPIISLRRGNVRAADGEEILHYPQEVRKHPFSLPEKLLSDLAENTHGLNGVVLHGTFNPPMATLGAHLRKHGIPYIFIPHDPYVDGLLKHKRLRKKLYFKAFEKALIEGSAAVQLLDKSHERPLRAMGCKARTVVIPNGCEPEMLDHFPNDAREPGKDSEDVRFLYFGRMDRNHKGLDLLLEAFALAIEKSPALTSTVTLTMTGNDWTDRAELESLSETLGLGGRVTFTGRSPEHAMDIVAKADLVVLPSRFDGFGLCIVEAMLGARPVLVSKGAGVAGHVANAGGGYLAEPTANSIAGAILNALEDRVNWKEKGLCNRKYVLENLTWDQVAMQTLEAYGSVFALPA